MKTTPMHAWSRITPIILLLIAASVAPAQELKTLPEPGKLLGYVAAEEPGKWLVFGPGGITIVQPTVIDGGRAVFWQGAAGEYAVVFLPPGDAQPLPINVVLGPATPPTPPNPPDPPKPPPTPPLSPLAQQFRDWAIKLVPPSALLKCEAVAQSLDAVNAQMAAGTLREPARIIAATKDGNSAAVGELRDAWLPFFEQLRTYLNAESAAGRLATVAQHQVVWKDLATGLRAAAK